MKKILLFLTMIFLAQINMINAMIVKDDPSDQKSSSRSKSSECSDVNSDEFNGPRVTNDHISDDFEQIEGEYISSDEMDNNYRDLENKSAIENYVSSSDDSANEIIDVVTKLAFSGQLTIAYSILQTPTHLAKLIMENQLYTCLMEMFAAHQKYLQINYKNDNDIIHELQTFAIFVAATTGCAAFLIDILPQIKCDCHEYTIDNQSADDLFYRCLLNDHADVFQILIESFNILDNMSTKPDLNKIYIFACEQKRQNIVALFQCDYYLQKFIPKDF